MVTRSRYYQQLIEGKHCQSYSAANPCRPQPSRRSSAGNNEDSLSVGSSPTIQVNVIWAIRDPDQVRLQLNPVLNHIVCNSQKSIGDLKPSSFRRLFVDNKSEGSWLLHWQIGGLFASKNAINVYRGPPKLIHNVWTV